MVFPLILLLTLLFAVAIVVSLMAWAMLHPPRMTDGKAVYLLGRLSPADLGLRFDNVSFDVRDARTESTAHLAGWWIPHPVQSDACAILVHGYADAKVGAIAWAPALQKAGLHLLALDLRAHGESTGTICTGGKFEADDLEQTITQLREKYPLSTKRVYLFGISLGACIASEVASRRSDIAGLIVESPVVSFQSGLVAQAKLSRAPGGVLQSLAIGLAQWFARAGFDEISLVRSLPKATCRKMVILPADDPLVLESDRQELMKLADDAWLVPGAKHLQNLEITGDEYARRIGSFIQNARS